MNLLQQIQQKFADALAGLAPDGSSYLTMIKPAQDARFGDYQANCAMPLAKVLGRKPREIAATIVEKLDTGELIEQPEIAGPGFINLRVKSGWLAAQLQRIAADERLGVSPAHHPETIIIDFSSPNVAKPMHVGHLRSTIIGAALASLYRFLGHHIITDNHLGDWGTQFGILLYGYKHYRDEKALGEDPVREMVRLYVLVRGMMKSRETADENEEADSDSPTEMSAPAAQEAKTDPLRLDRKTKFVDDPITTAVREETAKLHAGDPENVRLWQIFMPWCVADIERIYRRLGVHFDHMHGESFYNPQLPGIVERALEKGIAEPSQGAIAIFLKPDQPPAIIQKQDGAFTYTTSDLATIEYRMHNWQPDRVLYVVGNPQSLHFQNLFEAARRWGYSDVKLEHIAFGSVLGSNRKVIKTREGGAIELSHLLDEAVERAQQVYERSRNERRERGEDVPDLSPAERRHIAAIVGIGAVKYADLSQNRTTDYVFDWDKMMAMDGNTGTYMQYVYARIRSIFRKGEVDVARLRREAPLPVLGTPEERTLALQLLRLEETLVAAAADYKPNIVTAYLWDVAKSYNGFYQNCPVLKAETSAVRDSRLVLCDLAARTIQLGLELLGIGTVERM